MKFDRILSIRSVNF